MIDPTNFSLDLHDANKWASCIVILFLCLEVAVFSFKWRHQSIPIMQVLTILLIN